MKRPLSFLMGRDNEALELLFSVHAVQNPRILDVTANKGVMWKNTAYTPVRCDLRYFQQNHVRADFSALPFKNQSFDVIVFDPPHMAGAGSENSSKLWLDRYGLTPEWDAQHGNDISASFKPFLVQAARILKPDGVIFAKIADLIHDHRYQWQHVQFIQAVQEMGLTPCDLLVKSDPAAGNLKSSKWNTVHHLRKAHCYWIVVRNSSKCERSKTEHSELTPIHTQELQLKLFA